MPDFKKSRTHSTIQDKIALMIGRAALEGNLAEDDIRNLGRMSEDDKETAASIFTSLEDLTNADIELHNFDQSMVCRMYEDFNERFPTILELIYTTAYNN